MTASKDGAVRVWDGVTAQCVRTIAQAHRSTEVTSARFTKDGRLKVNALIYSVKLHRLVDHS